MDDLPAPLESVPSTPRLREAVDHLLEDCFVWPRSFINRDVATRLNLLPLDVYETPDQIVVKMIVPGVKADQVNLRFNDHHLLVDVVIPETKLENVTWRYRELGSGPYHREISLPFPVDTDRVEASLEHGYLTLHIPKADEVRGKRIQITRQESSR